MTPKEIDELWDAIYANMEEAGMHTREAARCTKKAGDLAQRIYASYKPKPDLHLVGEDDVQ